MHAYFVLAFLVVPLVAGFNHFNLNKKPCSQLSCLAKKNYPFSRNYYEKYIKRLNSKNVTSQGHEILSGDDFFNENSTFIGTTGGIRIIINDGVPFLQIPGLGPQSHDESEEDTEYQQVHRRMRNQWNASQKKNPKSENFELVTTSDINFTHIGGYDSVKQELYQVLDLLKNHTKYAAFNVRTPKGLIFEGPPGNGKTLLAKALAGEAGIGFVPVSGAEFQEKYVGVGSARIRELFAFAKKHIPCIIFFDEMDALGRARGKDGESSSAERDNTLNELLVALDGFKNTSGVFIIGATNRADLLDSALLRPGRIDKRIFIGNPDEKTRAAIIKIHSIGKPRTIDVLDESLIELTAGFSGAEIENILNEAMLSALRDNREAFSMTDIDYVLNKVIAGWQPTDHELTTDIIEHIAIHELGHAVVGLLCSHHSKMKKVIINLSSPTSPAYTVFESSTTSIFTREALFEHLMILLAGRIAEEVIYGVSVTTGAISDFEEALKLANKMITYYGMGEHAIYPNSSEKYKEVIDDEISDLIENAYSYAKYIVENSKDFVIEGAALLQEKKMVPADELIDIITEKYPDIFNMKT